jgi:hypothetical protein
VAAPTSKAADASVIDQSASDSPSRSASATTKPDLPDERTLQQYFDGISTNTPAELQTAVDLAKPKSNAAAYATYLLAGEQANIDAGYPQPANATAHKTDGGYEACYPDEQGKETCVLYTDIKGAEGKLADFSVNGRKLGERITIGNGRPIWATDLGVEASFIASYVTASADDLIVVQSLKTSANPIHINAGTYRSPSGRQSQSSNIAGPLNLGPSSVANYSLTFTAAEPGGTVTLDFYSDDYMQHPSVMLKTR